MSTGTLPPSQTVIRCEAGALTIIITDVRTAEVKSTLYPKIGKLSDFLYKCKMLAPETRTIPITGTVKLHGAHVDWVISHNNSIRVQSRNMLELTVQNDNYGFAAFSQPIHNVILTLREDIVRRYTQLRPDLAIDPDYPVIIAGEWCGQGVQKGMAVSQLPRHFVIISIRINDVWVSETDYSDIHDEANGIYHIGKAGCYQLDLDSEDINSSEAAIQAIVTNVERTCPYGLVRGVTGPGEGIVWKARDHMDNPDMWFKYKGDSIAVSHDWKNVKLPEVAVAASNPEREYNFAKSVVTERRLEQGLEYLAEIGTARKDGLGKFLAWVQKDVLVEEKIEMGARGIGQGKLKPAIRSIAKAWYNKKLIEDFREEEERNKMEKITEGMKNMAA
ncbi:MAG: hypothetical protein Q9209_002673 [Squamulea sp. 1 TL-2023]